MKTFLNNLFIVSILNLLVACANSHSIYRTTDLSKNNGDKGNSIILDAEQRLVTNTKFERSRNSQYVQPERIICPEPSPDIASSLSTAITSSLEKINVDGSRLSGNAGFSAAESIAQLGERLATIQLLRDELSDLCRSYANGAVSTTNYTLRLAQLDEKMVTLLTAEMAAGAFGRAGASSFGGAKFGEVEDEAVSQEVIQAQRDRLETQEDEVVTAEADVTSHLLSRPEQPASDASASDKEAFQTQLATWNQQLNVKRAQLANEQTALQREKIAYAELQSNLSQLGRSVISVSDGQGAITAINEAVGKYLVQLQQNYLDRDEANSILDTCLTRMSQFSDTSGDQSIRAYQDELYQDLADKRKELVEIRTQLISLQNLLEKDRRKKIDALEAEYFVSQDYCKKESRHLTDTQLQDCEPLYKKISNELHFQFSERQAEIDALRLREDSFADQIEDLRIQLDSSALENLSDLRAFCEQTMYPLAAQLINTQNAKLELKLQQEEASIKIAALQSKNVEARATMCAAYINKLSNEHDLASDPFVKSCMAGESLTEAPFLATSLGLRVNNQIQTKDASKDDKLDTTREEYRF